MLFRSPLTRYVLAAAGLFAGVMLAFGPDRWRSTPALEWLSQAPIPLRAWGFAFMAYALMLLWQQTRPAGYATGAVLWAIFTFSLFATIPEDGPKSALAIAAFIDVTVFHAFSVRTAWAQKLLGQ